MREQEGKPRAKTRAKREAWERLGNDLEDIQGTKKLNSEQCQELQKQRLKSSKNY